MIEEFYHSNENKEVFDGVIKKVSISQLSCDFSGFRHGENKITLNSDGSGELIFFNEQRFIVANEEDLARENSRILRENGIVNINAEIKEIYRFRFLDLTLLDKIANYFSKPFKKTDEVVIDGGSYEVCLTNCEGKSYFYGDMEVFEDKEWEELYDSVWEIARKVEVANHYPEPYDVCR